MSRRREGPDDAMFVSLQISVLGRSGVELLFPRSFELFS